MPDEKVRVAIVDYGLGNLYSVKQACEFAGMETEITFSRDDLFAADVVILPGVGAFGDAMASLRKLDLVKPLQDIGQSDQWLIGICLGLQLLMTESYEFGTHKGLGIIEGAVIPLEPHDNPESLDGFPKRLKVPQVGWNRIWGGAEVRIPGAESSVLWTDTPLSGILDGEYMYFVHSFYVQPSNPELVVSSSQYGRVEFCSSLQYNSTFACQFHPERSGQQGLRVYKNIANMVKKSLE